MTSDPIQSAYRRTWWSLVLRGLLSLAVGVFIFWRPMESVASFALVIALLAVFNGAVECVHSFDLRPVYTGWWVMLLSGLVSVGFGVAALYYYPVLSLTFAVVWTAWWLLLIGGFAIYIAVQERRFGLTWGWTMFFGIVAVVTAVYAFVYPPATLAAIMGLIAGFAIVGGVVHLIGAYKLGSARNAIATTIRPPRPA
jgi:uncharacterized membrane protein HdeD (DUF308 family)